MTRLKPGRSQLRIITNDIITCNMMQYNAIWCNMMYYDVLGYSSCVLMSITITSPFLPLVPKSLHSNGSLGSLLLGGVLETLSYPIAWSSSLQRETRSWADNWGEHSILKDSMDNGTLHWRNRIIQQNRGFLNIDQDQYFVTYCFRGAIKIIQGFVWFPLCP